MINRRHSLLQSYAYTSDTDESSSDDDIGEKALDDVALQDIFSVDELIKIQETLYTALGIPSAVGTPDGALITPVIGCSDLCAAVRATAAGTSYCASSDASFTLHSPGQTYEVHPCLSIGLLDSSMGIWLGSKQLGLWYSGQIRLKGQGWNPDLARFAESLGLDVEEFRRDFLKLPEWEFDDFNLRLKFQAMYMRYLSAMAFESYRSSRLSLELAEKNEELKQTAEELEGEIKRRMEALKETNESLARCLKSRRVFLGRISEDMRTPLLGIYGASQLLENGEMAEGDGDLESTIMIMQTSCEILMGFIDQILEFSRLEVIMENNAETSSIEQKNLDILKHIRSTCAILENVAAEKDVALSVEADSSFPSSLLCDPLRLSQLTSNLVGNAVKMTPDHGSVQVHLELLRDGVPRLIPPDANIAIVDELENQDADIPQLCHASDLEGRLPKAREDEVLVAITVQDNGPGIAEDRLYRIFSAFSQTDVGTPRVYGGSGLGLSMCRSIVVAMYHGLIVACNTEAGGALFSVILPLKVGSGSPLDEFKEMTSAYPVLRRHSIDYEHSKSFLDSVEEHDLTEHHTPPESTGQVKQILIVDDISVNRIIVGRLIRSALKDKSEFSISFARSGEECLELIKSGRRFDLIFLDLFMPNGIDGHLTAQQIRAHERTSIDSRTPLVALSATIDASVIQQCERDGFFDAFLRKPFKQHDLEQTLTAFLIDGGVEEEASASDSDVSYV
ncbi:Sensory domain found in PocR [Carpediemonas membranifera]|uniref:Sensory domain found in PocR n=1 Tax=Carpediemonas membranifera TaxID=201153 RepID=A0A8J6BVG9_9EUKA|nr:Sensory domain found in PocR [Carpediemonas membranifera]|eukprot:KAG9391401.1 Sensory domain found in PocR [Carpediemonas membranifera]